MSHVRRAGFCVAVALLATVTRAAAQSLRVSADASAGHRAVLVVGPVLSQPAIEEALGSGLPVRMRFRVELWRDEWFDDLTGSASWTAVLMQEPLSDRYVIRSTDDEDARRVFASYAGARAALERAYALPLRPPAPGRYYYTATLELETLSLSDLEELDRWMRGELQPAVAGEQPLPSAIGAGFRRLLVRVLGLPAGRFEARSSGFSP